MNRLFDADRFTGIREDFYQDPMTKKIHIKKSQDVVKMLDLNQAEIQSNNKSFKGDMHKVATIPLIFIDMWREELKKIGASNINPLSKENRIFFIAKINSREYSKLRVKEGRI